MPNELKILSESYCAAVIERGNWRNCEGFPVARGCDFCPDGAGCAEYKEYLQLNRIVTVAREELRTAQGLAN
jgi:hypothetical protein